MNLYIIMIWKLSNTANKIACQLADRHYSRRTIGAPQMMPPGRKIVLLSIDNNAVWGTHWPYHELVMHSFGDCWICSIFRNESNYLSSKMISQAESVTRFIFGDPPSGGFISFINKNKIKSENPGYCFKMAGWTKIGKTKSGLIVLNHKSVEIPQAQMPIKYQLKLF